MDTAYKTRTWWMLRALAYLRSVGAAEQAIADTGTVTERPAQVRIWKDEGLRSAANAMAAAGAECFQRLFVDRSGNLLPEYAS